MPGAKENLNNNVYIKGLQEPFESVNFDAIVLIGYHNGHPVNKQSETTQITEELAKHLGEKKKKASVVVSSLDTSKGYFSLATVSIFE